MQSMLTMLTVGRVSVPQADHDSGDMHGDMGFLLANYINSGKCARRPPPLPLTEL